MSNEKLVFIGAGNMATALIAGLVADGTPADKITATDMDKEKLSALAATTGINTETDNLTAAKDADVIILAVKPQSMQQALNQLSEIFKSKSPLLVSIAAGIRLNSIQQWAGSEKLAVVRTMPNTPAMIQAGASVLFAGESVSHNQKDVAERILRAVGLTRWVDDESLIDAATAVSGSGPAYFFLFMEAMASAAESLGLDKESAHLLTLQTALGAARMAMESSDDPATLREKVTSPGGTTEEAIKTFREGMLDELVTKAVTAARDRSIELSKMIGDN